MAGYGGRHGRRFGIQARLLAVNSFVVATCIATTIVVAAAVGPPMFDRLMDSAMAARNSGDHPYQRAFAEATAMAVGTALAVSVVAAMALSWYFSRRFHRSATELSHAARAIANGRYDVRVPPPHLGAEFDEIAQDFNIMARRLADVEDSRRRMLADLAHEIRTPVAVLEAYMEALEDGVQTFDNDTIGVFREQTGRLTRFSGEVGRLATVEQATTLVDAHPLRLDRLVATAIAGFEPRYRAKGVHLESHVPKDFPVLADAERLGQVLGNLLDNALRHTHRGDRVDVLADKGHDASAIVVSDTGDGVSAEHLPYLFDRFYRVDAARDREHGGSGIGLAIVKAIVEAHGGYISADSARPGTGCTFTLTLPDRTSALSSTD